MSIQKRKIRDCHRTAVPLDYDDRLILKELIQGRYFGRLRDFYKGRRWHERRIEDLQNMVTIVETIDTQTGVNKDNLAVSMMEYYDRIVKDDYPPDQRRWHRTRNVPPSRKEEPVVVSFFNNTRYARLQSPLGDDKLKET